MSLALILGAFQPTFAQDPASPCELLSPIEALEKSTDPYTLALATFSEDPANWDGIPLSSAAMVAYSVAQGIETSEKMIAKAIKKTRSLEEIPSETQLRRKIRKAFTYLNKVGFFARLGRWFVVTDSEMQAVRLEKQIEDDLVATLAAQNRLRENTAFENIRFQYWTDAVNFKRILLASLIGIPSLVQGYPPPYLPEIDVLRRNPEHAQKIQTGIRLVAAVYLGVMIGISAQRMQQQMEVLQQEMIQAQQAEIQKREHMRNQLRQELERQLKLAPPRASD